MTSHLVIGHRGQVGAAVHAALEERTAAKVAGFDLVDKRPSFARWDDFAVLHVCTPGDADDFAASVAKYQRMVRPELTVVYSSTPVGTCKALGAVHSPIEGQHHTGDSILAALVRLPRPSGADTDRQRDLMNALWYPVLDFPSSAATEFLKLRSTTLYGLQLAFARYTSDGLDQLGVDDDAWIAYDRWYNDVWVENPELRRPILTAPDGPIGGHCVVPNAGLLDRFRTSPLVRAVATFNDRFRREERAS